LQSKAGEIVLETVQSFSQTNSTNWFSRRFFFNKNFGDYTVIIIHKDVNYDM